MTGRGTILIVDDDLESLRVLCDTLQADGYQARPADTGELALESVRAMSPDLILLDIQLPGLDGLEVCRRLKARNESRDIPLIFISAAHDLEKCVEGLRLGAVDFISKPFRNQELQARIHTHLELSRLRAQLEACIAERTEELVAANRQLQSELAERIRTEQALRESEERFRNMADTAPVMIWTSGTDKRCTFFNKGWLEFTGREMEQVLGDGWAADVHDDDRSHCFETYCSAFESRRPFQMEYRLRRADGEYRWVLDDGIPRFTRDGMFMGYIGSCVDVTELKRGQEQLLATQKLESLGVLSAGLAHDFNNMLGSIFAEADLAYDDLPSDSPVRGNLDRIAAVAMRGSEVLNLMMDYAGGKGDSGAFESVDLCLLIEEMLEFLKLSISKKAMLEIGLAGDLPPVRGNANQLQRVVINLVLNASEALGEKNGVIRVTANRVPSGPEFRSSGEGDARKGACVLLDVSDTGRGMTEEEQLKAFDPFYTTKAAGRGLGLSAVQGIVRSCGGVINVISAPGKGSTFRVFLPEASLTETKVARTPIASDQWSPQSRTILLVEDEETLRAAATQRLERSGFSVRSVGEGQAAVDVFQNFADEIDIVVLDLTLPGMSGVEVLTEMRRIRPSLKVILTSAYDRETASAGFARDGSAVDRFIRKPYRLAELISTIREALTHTERTAAMWPARCQGADEARRMRY